MQLSDLIAYRDIVFGAFETAKGTGSPKARSLAFQIASLDESIGEELQKTGEMDQAAYWFVSQGEYLIEIGRIAEAKVAWEKAKSIATKDVIKKWVDEGLQKYA
jgi:hypothetical protein